MARIFTVHFNFNGEGTKVRFEFEDNAKAFADRLAFAGIDATVTDEDRNEVYEAGPDAEATSFVAGRIAEDEDGKGAPLGDVVEGAASEFTPGTSLSALRRLLMNGDVYAPTTTTLRRVNPPDTE